MKFPWKLRKKKQEKEKYWRDRDKTKWQENWKNANYKLKEEKNDINFWWKVIKKIVFENKINK